MSLKRVYCAEIKSDFWKRLKNKGFIMCSLTNEELLRACYLINEWILDFKSSSMKSVIDELILFEKAEVDIKALATLLIYTKYKVENIPAFLIEIRLEEIEFLSIFDEKIITTGDIDFINVQMKKYNSHS